jgi:bifunctional non-homologous end joining protein LigD
MTIQQQKAKSDVSPQPVATANEDVTLYYEKGTSNKTYRCWLEPSDGGYVVNFAYGRWGGPLTTGTKTPTPVEREEARYIFAKLVAAKKKKGYEVGTDNQEPETI